MTSQIIDHGENDAIPVPDPTDSEKVMHRIALENIREQVRQRNARDQGEE